MRRRVAFVLSLFHSWLACSQRDTFHPRPITLVSPDRNVDTALATARQSALEGDLERAESILQTLLQQHPHDPLAPVARLFMARIALAQGNTERAEQLANTTEVSSDPALARTQRLVLGIAAVRSRNPSRALSLLRPLEGRLPDRAETAELSCALAEAETQAGDPARALRALVTIETLATEGTPWISIGQHCETPDSRLTLLSQILEHISEPETLATTLERLPPNSPLRRPVAVRLRTLAEQTRQLSRWLAWLTDLPDDRSARTPEGSTPTTSRLVVGLLAPLTGTRSAVGVTMVRAAQYAIEQFQNIRLVPEDEGNAPASVAAAVDRLVHHGARAIVGVSREDLAAAAAIRAQSLGVDLWLIAPSDGIEATGPRIHRAGPEPNTRTNALARAIPRNATSVTIVNVDEGEIPSQLERLLSSNGRTVTRTRELPAPHRNGHISTVHLVTGTAGREFRTALARIAERAPTTWIFEARSALPASAGTWIGLPPGPAFPSVLTTYCERTGEPPEEIALLTHDAIRAAVAFLRRQPPLPTALAHGESLVSVTIEASNQTPAQTIPAAAARCPESSPP